METILRSLSENERKKTSGLELAIINKTKSVQGTQAGLVNEVDTLTGAQIGLLNETDTLTGAQIGGGNINYNNAKGIQIGVYGNRSEDLTGVQLGGIINYTTRGCKGAQVGTLNYADKSTGIQIGMVNGTRYTSTGAQIGVLNGSNLSKGIQAGVVNFSDKYIGLQTGLINIITEDSKGIQLGLFNIRTDSPWYSRVIPIIRISTGKKSSE
jgi:hypothetical protein